jgi:ABC-type phosphate transport system substrate-binding protein
MKGEIEMKKLLYASLLLGLTMAFSVRARAQVIVVANSSVSADSISKAELRDVFLGASTSVHGSRVKPVLLKEGPTHTDFVTNYVGRAPVAFIMVWRGLVLSGQATMPKTLDTDAAVVDYVARTPGAIGYVSKGSSHDAVKVLTVN